MYISAELWPTCGQCEPTCQIQLFRSNFPQAFVFICIEMSAIAKKGKGYVKSLITNELKVLSLRHNGN
ncbi:MAG: hypothetical protein CL579_06330 [Alteromonadaceae bacterium]|nr:hypothetical protein [Alteromonadaceae bacterium]MBB19090.1 hypothetical protein [Rickettsiales bacterium]